MKKWLIILFSIVVFSGCGQKRENIQPKYNFETNKNLIYRMELSGEANIDAGLVKFNGNINISGIIEIQALSKDSNDVYKLRLKLKKLSIKGANGLIYKYLIANINMIQSWFSVIYLDEYGKPVIFYKGKPNSILSLYASFLFPNFSDMSSLWNSAERTTNFTTAYPKTKLKFITKLTTKKGITGIEKGNIRLINYTDVNIYEAEEYEKSVEPQPIATLTLDIQDIFDYISGKLVNKKGNGILSARFSIKNGLFAYDITMEANGKLNIYIVNTSG